MIREIVGDIFEASSQTLVNTVNCRGVMGKGLALQFKLRYPDMYTDYVQRCRAHKVRIGEPYLFKADGVWILNFPTKDDWRQPSKLDYIEKGLRYFTDRYREWGVRSIAFPQLGCQNGGLDWTEVGPLMRRYLDSLDIDVQIYVRDGGQLRQRSPLVERINKAQTVEALSKALGAGCLRTDQAAAILEYRRAHGEFEWLGQLMLVPMVNAKTYQRIAARLGAASTGNAEERTDRGEHREQLPLL